MKTNIPKLRFVEFKDAPSWEEKKLGEVAKLVTEKNKLNKISNVLTNSSSKGLISQEDYFEREITTESNLNNYYVVEKGDFVYNPRKSVHSPYGPVNENYRYECGIVSPLYWVFRPLYNKIDSRYISHFFKSNKWYKYMYQNGDYGTRHDRVSMTNSLFLNIPILLSSLYEQEKIGRFLSTLDKRIELQEKLVEKLEEEKKGYLQKLFPKKGKSIPELRFDEFKGAGEWEAVKLSKLICEYSNKTTYNNQYQILSSTKNGLFLQSEYFDKQIASDNNIGYRIIKKDQFILSPQNAWMGNYNVNDKYEVGIVSPSYKVFDINDTVMDIPFFNGMIKTIGFNEKIVNNSESGASIVRKSLRLESLLEEKMFVPSLEEQRQVGRHITNIDHMYIKCAEHLLQLKNYKKNMIEKVLI